MINNYTSTPLPVFSIHNEPIQRNSAIFKGSIDTYAKDLCHNGVAPILEPRRIAPARRSSYFPVENDRSMLPTNYETPRQFLKRMEAGEFDGKLHEELQKLTKDQLMKLAAVLLYRDGQVAETNTPS